MSKIIWNAQAALWRALAGVIPTCFLQWELNKRPGVQATVLELDESRCFPATGPCTVTVNRD